ncbi:phosphohydrolase [Roseobacter cerasinus]|uniref:Phosphohydrolase n=1 Tax=Roseobacter cerasinus TaxID=2602289 RepID=A0A640VYZ4_9RHOB|nr:HD domain-containing protein [Roseobacter cerasinus]GFE52185.1 phosphohydrolase [Roseobacter cerasinus]
MLHQLFPHPDLAEALLPQAFDVRDGAHDEAHLLRVWRNVAAIRSQEGGDIEVLQAATLLHDCVWVDKTSPERPLASRKAAAKAREVLCSLDWDKERIDQVAHAIEAHSFSAGIAPVTREARILQDADRLDAMGFIGVARCLYLTGQRRASLYHLTDPSAQERPLDEDHFALDHFQTKLLHLGDHMQTKTGQIMAHERSARLKTYYRDLLEEIAGGELGGA